ncbi:MAG: class II aldolase/adducin family protein [Acetivibrionales bacterium]|jgi:L-fuculose-phosphate aldolase|nr:class II aldolase/adducin family protein [Bacillota bacterium]NLP08521.1 aldolase [Clostridiaceae bacterium]HOA54467.1 class II aldolase/adducin family protein [Clostridiales bacterium]HQD31144.1 class II aldolase/adducin family protein [Clostridiales bacterium]
MSMQFYEERKKLAKTMKLLWDRKLTNAAGGNAAVRVAENRIIITPSMMSEHKHCEIDADNILLCDYDLNVLEGTGVLSRESRMHAMLLKNIPEIGAVIHAHPEYTMVYVAARKPIPSVTEATQKMGDCQLIAQAKAYSQDLAENVYDFFKDKREQLKKTGLCALLPLHGTVAVGKHLEQAFSVVERVECDAKCGIFGKLIE